MRRSFRSQQSVQGQIEKGIEEYNQQKRDEAEKAKEQGVDINQPNSVEERLTYESTMNYLRN